RVLRYTPPFGAAAMTGSGVEGVSGIAVICTWLLGLCAALVALERRPMYRQRIETTAISFESTYERVAEWFGAEDAPLVAHWLRFYVRNYRFRKNLMVTIPFVPLLTVMHARPGGARNLFLAALGTFPVATFLGLHRFTINQFGYLDGGLRRYFLLPVSPAALLPTGSYASMLVGAPMAALAVIGWVVLAPVTFDARMVFILATRSFTGMLVFRI